MENRLSTDFKDCCTTTGERLLSNKSYFMCYREFGIKVVNIKPLVKRLPVLLEDRDKTVRDETKLMTVEMFRWIGAALNPQLSSLKPVQVKIMFLFNRHLTLSRLA